MRSLAVCLLIFALASCSRPDGVECVSWRCEEAHLTVLQTRNLDGSVAYAWEPLSDEAAAFVRAQNLCLASIDSVETRRETFGPAEFVSQTADGHYVKCPTTE